jgi:hypothetical protein
MHHALDQEVESVHDMTEYLYSNIVIVLDRHALDQEVEVYVVHDKTK